MTRNDFDVILKSWELNEDIHKWVTEWKEKNEDIISRYIMLGQNNIQFQFDINENNKWFKYGIRVIDIEVQDITNIFKYQYILNVDIQFLLWPFLCNRAKIKVISTDYILQSGDKLILTGIEPGSLKIIFDEGINLSNYHSYEHLNVSNHRELDYIWKYQVRGIDSLTLCYFNQNTESEMEELLEYIFYKDIMDVNANVYLELNNNIENSLVRLLNVLDRMDYKTGKSIQLHLKLNTKESKFRRSVKYKIEDLKQYFNTIKFNDNLY